LRKKGRDEDGAFIIEGFILIGDAARAGIEIERVFWRGPDPGGREGAEGAREAELRALLAGGGESPGSGFEALSLAEELFDGIADTVSPKGVIAVAKKPRYPAERRGDALLVLDRIRDPGNVGALIRTADALGAGGALCVKGTADPFSPKVVRAAAGALFRLPVYESGGPEETLSALRAEGYRIVALDARGPALCWETDLTGRVALVVGNEGEGVSPCFTGSADAVVRVPMTEGAESLNAAAAAGMAMYERCRQASAPRRSRAES
jgi:TrmH family RNA methyltransferase